METLTQLQKDILLRWVTICKINQSIDTNLSFYYYTDEEEAIIEFVIKREREKHNIPYNDRGKWLDMFTELEDKDIIKMTSKPYSTNVLRSFIFGFVSIDALETISKQLIN